VNKAKIGQIGIIPLDEDGQLLIDDFPFDIEKNRLIYQISYNGLAWYFKDKNDAITLLSTLLKFKENALHNKFIKNIKFQEDKK